VPYSGSDVEGVAGSLATQGQQITASLAGAGIETRPDREIVALIAYLQRLGREGKAHLSNESGGGE
jgi:cytochrome c oxidase cbb3-type subunit I/II